MMQIDIQIDIANSRGSFRSRTQFMLFREGSFLYLKMQQFSVTLIFYFNGVRQKLYKRQTESRAVCLDSGLGCKRRACQLTRPALSGSQSMIT